MSDRRLLVRRPAVAGSFYPGDPEVLRRTLAECFAGAAATEGPDGTPAPPDTPVPVPKALIVPHAGLVYSGPIAASAYARLATAADQVRRVVLLGPSHRVAFQGIAATGADLFATPLGTVRVDTSLVRSLCDAGLARVDDRAHAQEHSLEVQLPFLQTVVPDATLAPFVVGDASAHEVAALLDAVWDDPGTVIVVSTDLSHYHRYDEAVRLDQQTAAEILARRPDRVSDRDACGARPLRGLLEVAARRHLVVEELDLRNSGDTAGDRERVVGYGAFALT